MARCLPASHLRSSKQRPAGPKLRDKPREGSRLRAIYDALQSNKGAPVEIHLDGNELRQLSDFYGLDIRNVRRGFHREGCQGWREPAHLLAGEWFGRVYIDYVAERLETAQ